jgi:two-component system, OmpR family, response regulator
MRQSAYSDTNTSNAALTMTKVLLIDDDTELSALLAEYLSEEGFEVDTARDGRTGAERAISGEFAIVVLDIMMPGLSGTDALRRIRRTSQIPVIMLTARGDSADRITGLDLGADDYVPKPCTPGELAARLRAVLRRTAAPEIVTSSDVIEAGKLRLWPAARRAEWQGQHLDLTGMEFNILEVLARHAGQLVGRDELSHTIFGHPLEPFDRRIDVHISSIRQKLGVTASGSSRIQTVRGQGYQLVKD